MELYLPYYTDDVDLDNKQLFLNKVFLPQMSNIKSELYKFFRENNKSIQEEIRKNKRLSEKFISLNPEFGCDFESFARHSKTKGRQKHIEFMENIKPHQLAAIYPYARFYFIPEGNLSASETKASAVPIVFDKAFDLEYFQKNLKSTSRGEGAGLISVTANRIYDVTGDFDPITLSARFFFSSYDVFINKPAIEKSQLFGGTYNSNLSNRALRTGFFNQINNRNVTYKELVRRPLPSQAAEPNQRSLGFSLLLEYGWTYSPGVTDDILSPKEKEIIDNHERTFYRLSPKEHNISFNPDGSFFLNVEYVPTFLETLERSTNFKNGIYNCAELGTVPQYSRVKTIKGAIEKLAKENRQKNVSKELRAENIKLIKRKRQELEKAQNRLAATFAKQFMTLAREHGLLYYLDVKGRKTNNDQYQSDLTLARVDPSLGNPLANLDNFFISKKVYNADTILKNLERTLSEEDKLAFFGGNDLRDQEMLEKILKPMLEYEISGSFILLKDIFRLVYYIAEKTLGNFDYETNGNQSKVPPLPYHILGNAAFVSTDGRKYWCNIGDIPITYENAVANITKFVQQHPTGNPRAFIIYFLQKVLPSLIPNKKERQAFPVIASPYFHFNASKFKKTQVKEENEFDRSFGSDRGNPSSIDSTASIPTTIGLFQGSELFFNDFCRNYFNEADEKSSEGCFFIGQAANLFYENSKLFLSAKVNAFQENFFKSDKQLRDIGIGKLIIGSSKGLVKQISFSSASDDSITNLSYALATLKPKVPNDLITTNFQYSINAELFGNRIFEFSNLIYVPSWSFGAALPSIPSGDLTEAQIEQLRQQTRTNDFEIGGLYTINNVTDSLDLSNGTYNKTINASCILRDSAALLKKLDNFSKQNKGILVPVTTENVPLFDFIVENIEEIYQRINPYNVAVPNINFGQGLNKDLRQQTQLSLSTPEDKEKLKEEFAPDPELTLTSRKLNVDRIALGLDPLSLPSPTNTEGG